MAVPVRIKDRIRTGLKKYRRLLKTQRDRDVSEADTVTLVKDVLSDVFGYDKYTELTGEFQVRGTFCDLAVHFDKKVQLLIEVKAIGIDLNERHVKQAVDYAANQGVEWVALTNGIEWILYRMLFRKPIDKETVLRLNLVEIDAKKEDGLEKLYLLTKTGIKKNALEDYRERKDATSRFMIAAILTKSDPVLTAIRKEVRKISDILVDKDEVERVLRDQVIKREALEGEEAEHAKKRLMKHIRKQTRARAKKEEARGDVAKAQAPEAEPKVAPDPE